MTTVLYATLLVAAVSAVLAALLLLAERYLANYGRCSIDVNAGRKRIDVPGGRSLLASLGAGGVFVPSACGGRGTCSYCKVKVLDGGGPLAPTEQPLLTAAEIEAAHDAAVERLQNELDAERR